MADLWSRYGLSAPPSASLFSHGTSSGARFPNFDDPSYRTSNGSMPADPAAGLRSFMGDLFDLHFDPEFFLQCRIAAALLIFLVVVAGAIVMRRAWEGSLWVLRVVRKPDGSLIVPNFNIVFSLLEGVYGIILTSWLLLMPYWYNSTYEISRGPSSYPAWLCMSWCPLIAGAVWASWGVWHAVPSSKSPPGKDHRINKAGYFRPIMINTLCLGSPLLIFGSVACAAIPSWVHFARALRSYRAWQSRFAGDHSLSHDMLQDAQDIWSALLHSMFLASIAFILWCIAAFATTIFYASAGSRLLVALSRQLKTLNKAREVAADPPPLIPPQSPLRAELTSIGIDSGTDRSSCDPDGTSSNVSAGRDNTFFPAVRLSTMRTIRSSTNKRAIQATKGTSRKVDLQANFFKKIFNNFVVHFVAKLMAELCFAGLAIYVATGLYDAYERNRVQIFYERSLLWATWTSVVFGTVTLFSIAHRVYEPILDSFAALHEGGRRDPNLQRSAPMLSHSLCSVARLAELDAQGNFNSELWRHGQSNKRASVYTVSINDSGQHRPLRLSNRLSMTEYSSQDFSCTSDVIAGKSTVDRRSDIILLDEVQVSRSAASLQNSTGGGQSNSTTLGQPSRASPRPSPSSDTAHVSALSSATPMFPWADYSSLKSVSARQRSDTAASLPCPPDGQHPREASSPTRSTSQVLFSGLATPRRGMRRREVSESSTLNEGAVAAALSHSRRHSFRNFSTERDSYWSTAPLPDIPSADQQEQDEPWVVRLGWRQSLPPMPTAKVDSLAGDDDSSPQAMTPRADSLLDNLEGRSVHDHDTAITSDPSE